MVDVNVGVDIEELRDIKALISWRSTKEKVPVWLKVKLLEDKLS